MARRWPLFATIFTLLFCGFFSASATPTKIVAGVFSKAVSALVNWMWAFSSASNTAVSTRSMIKFEEGYDVETVFDGSKLGIEPYSLAVSPSGELLILDAENSNVHKISMPFSQFCRPRLFVGSSEGYSGHVDGKLRDARMSHPRGLTVDQRGNIYIADTKNKAIRKISDAGVTTIAGGKWRKSGHVDGPSEESKFSNDFDVVYVGSSCSLLVVDRGNQAIREIPLRAGDCTNEYDGTFLLGIALLTAAMLLGYMLAHFQFWVLAMFSSNNDSKVDSRNITSIRPYRRPEKPVRHPLIPSEVEEDNQPGENIISSLGKLFLNTGSSAAEILVALLLGARRKPSHPHIEQHYQVNKHGQSRFSMQESFAVPHARRPLHTMTVKPFSYSATRLENVHNYRRSCGNDGEWEGQPYPSSPKTWYNSNCEGNEVVFGEVQEENQLREQKEEKCCVGGGCVEGRSFSTNKDEKSFVTEKRRMRD